MPVFQGALHIYRNRIFPRCLESIVRPVIGNGQFNAVIKGIKPAIVVS